MRPTPDKLIYETMLFNRKILSKLEAKKFDCILLGDFNEAFQLDKSMNLKLQYSNGYIKGLKDAQLLTREEGDEWIESNREATLYRYTQAEIEEILHNNNIYDYYEWVEHKLHS